ncbi:hypothetical protein DFH09DRAFT_1083216 [Mycena vulgaris]|nr:hypothetical protein DFH09DRAFT_1083216 [Mycena vulgaris]
MAITRGSSARSSSPTPSENSDMYYDDFDNASPSPAPSQTADAFGGWENDGTPAPMDSRDATPTQEVRPSSPASVVEISREDFPPLPAQAPATVTKPRAAKAPKAKKGKEKAKATEAVAVEPITHTSDADDPFLAADIARATAASLGIQTSADHATTGASSSRRPAAPPGSPSKRQRANTAGDAAPAPFPPAVVVNAVPAPVTIQPAIPPPRPHTPIAAVTPAPAPAVVPVAAATVVPVAVAVVAPTAGAVVAPIAEAVTAPAAAAAGAPTFAQAVAQPAAAAVPAQPAVVANLPPMWLTADGLPPRGSYTPTPAGGFPPIVYSPELLLQGVPQDLSGMYDDVAQPKFFIVVSGGNGAVMKTHGLIRESIGNFINVDPTSFTLGTPPTAANGTSPALWLAADIPPQLAQAIIDHRIISSTGISLFPLPYNMPVIGFVGVFAGFTLPNTAAGANAARDLIRSAIAGNNEIAQFVQTHRDAFGPQVSAGQAWEIFLASVTVHGIVLLVNDTNTVAWRLYVDPSTNDRTFWGQCRRLFGKLSIMTALYGTARLQRAFRCHICPSIDHPTNLCPLPSTPGWLGPTPATIAALEDASRAAAAKAQEMMRATTFDAGGSNSRAGNGRGRGAPNSMARGEGRGKRGGDFKGKGKRRDDFF